MEALAKKTATEEKSLTLPISEGSLFYNVALFEHIQRVAKIFASSTMVPSHFRGNLGNCLIALDYAARIKANPFMVMQNMYIVHGRPGIEGKLVIALVNQSGRFEPLEFEEDDEGCFAYAKEKASGKILKGPKVTWEMVKAEGWDQPKQMRDGKGMIKSKWETMPQLMFRYRAATFFARTYCPEVLLGMLTTEEIEDIIETRQVNDYTYEPELKPEPPANEGAVKLFDEMFADEPLVDEFVAKTAEANGVSIEQVKVNAVEQEAAFREAFLQWKEQQQKPEPKKEPEEPPGQKPEVEAPTTSENGEDPFRKEYIKLRSGGFSTWVFKNLERIKQADEAHQKEIRDKWRKFYKEPYPLDPKPDEAAAKQDKPERLDEKVTVFCPRKEANVYIQVCRDKCQFAKVCSAYAEAIKALNHDEQQGVPAMVACPELDGGQRPATDCDNCSVRPNCPEWS